MVFFCSVPFCLADKRFGQFEGDIIARFLKDGRNMQLEESVTFVDPDGRRWDVPRGSETDGASIPRVLWICCPPFTGQYRAAAVIHDHFCRTQSRSWQDTHLVFYRAMRAAGVPDSTAKVMYAAVHHFGPRWEANGLVTRAPGAELDEPAQDKLFRDLQQWIERENPDLETVKGGPISGPSLGRARK